MRTLLRIALLTAAALVLQAAFAQHLSGTLTPGGGSSSICATGVTTNCVVGSVILDETPSTPVTLGTIAGVGTSYDFAIPSTDSWPVFTTHTIQAQTQYYGATAGTLLTTSSVTSGTGGNQITVENLLVLPPSAFTGTVTVSLMRTQDGTRGWLVWVPKDTEQPSETALIGE